MSVVEKMSLKTGMVVALCRIMETGNGFEETEESYELDVLNHPI